jgi:GntR family transcriptional regulator
VATVSLRVPLFIEYDEPDNAMKHQQIVNQISDQVALGLLRAGERLDTIAEIETALALSHATVSKAYALLQERGIIETARRKGSVIAVISDELRAVLQREWAERKLRPLMRECQLSRVDPHSVLRAFEAIMRLPGKANGNPNATTRKAVASS